MEDPKKLQDFEMGESNDETPQPKINNYTSDLRSPQYSPETSVPKVDPSAPAPEAPKADASAQTGATPIIKAPKKPIDLAARRKAMLGCLGGFGTVMVIFLVLAFIFIAQGAQNNPIAQLLGISPSSFINGLITFVHIVFIIAALAAFTFTMVGFFRSAMAKKDDKVTKKAGLKNALISGGTLIVLLFVWMFVYLYLDGKRIQSADAPKTGIVTEPEDTLGLTAPIEVRFDASNLPIDSNKFRIISYKWDFGDGETATNVIVSHVYKDKGKSGTGVFEVTLTVTKRDKATNEDIEDVYTTTVSIANEALTAIIEVDKQSGPAPLEVSFDASNSNDPDGNISSYEWDLDEDGEYDDAEGATVKHTFEKIGKYTVGLRVTSSTGEYGTAEKEIIVEEASLPKAVIEVADEPKEYFSGVQYVFKASESTSPNGEITTYEWDFGDGSPIKKNRTVSHTFNRTGNFEVTLKVIDEEKEEGESTMTINIITPQGTPVADIKTTPALGNATSLEGNVPFTVIFDASGSTDSDNNIVDYEWDFDNDGTVDSGGKQVSHTYTKEGTYTASLKVTDADNNSSTSNIIIKVNSQGIIADLQVDEQSGSVPLTVSFDAGGSTYKNGEIASYKWDFGDGTPIKFGSAQINHRYDKIGSFTATVTVIGTDNKTSTAQTIITVREIGLSACFTMAASQGPAPFTTSFNPSCSSGTIVSYFWEFGNGQTSTSVKPTHTYNEPGTYTVKLEISDPDNTISNSTQTVTVQ